MIKKEFKFENGQSVKEKITGFKGIITGTCYYLTGCNQYLITAKQVNESKEPIALWYDEGRLELIEDGVTVKAEEVVGEELGCDIAPTIGKRGA